MCACVCAECMHSCMCVCAGMYTPGSQPGVLGFPSVLETGALIDHHYVLQQDEMNTVVILCMWRQRRLLNLSLVQLMAVVKDLY